MTANPKKPQAKSRPDEQKLHTPDEFAIQSKVQYSTKLIQQMQQAQGMKVIVLTRGNLSGRLRTHCSESATP